MTTATRQKKTRQTTVRASELTFDLRVQRREGTDSRRVARIAADHDPRALGVITYSLRDSGQKVCLDGRHRAEGSIKAGYDKPIPAVEHTGLTLEEEARIFLLLNDTRTPTAVSRFLSRVVAGDPVAVDINRIVESNGWKVIQSNDPGCIACIDAVERVYRTGAGTKPDGSHPEVLDTTLSVLSSAWERDGRSMNANLVLGVAALVGRFGPSIDLKKLVTEMSHTRPDVLLGKGKVLRDVQGGTVGSAIAKILVGAHNKGRRTNTLPEWVWVR